MIRFITTAVLATSFAFATSALAQDASAPASAVVVVVDIPIPAGVPRERIVAGMEASVPQYKAVPGLIQKYFTISDAGSFGGVYLWRGRAEAVAWFNEAWRAGVRAKYGAAATVTYYDAPIVIEGAAAGSAPR